jgi:hypothetical protein
MSQPNPPTQPVPGLPTQTSTAATGSSWYSNLGQYAKGIIGVATAVVASLQPYYGSQHWFVGLVAGLGALTIIIVPNSPKP